jgi:hypothetical protein
MHHVTEQVEQEFRDARRYRGLPAPDERPRADTTQDPWAAFRAATRRAAGVRIVTVARG